MAVPRETGGYSLPRGGLLGGDPENPEGEKEHCPEEVRDCHPHGDLEQGKRGRNHI